MGKSELMVPGSTALREARAAVKWVAEDDLDELEEREPYAAGAMSLLVPGSGHIYNRDRLRGIGIAAAALVAVIFVPYGAIPYLAAGVVTAGLSFSNSRRVNRYIKARWREAQHEENRGKSTRLLAAMKRPGEKGAQENAQPIAADGSAVDRLRKLAALHRSGMITDLELAERKLDLLTEAATALSQKERDDLLFALLPLRREGSLEESDIEFVKSLSF